jgi:hypothetical protein
MPVFPSFPARSLVLALMAVWLVLAAACAGHDDQPPSPTAPRTQTASPSPGTTATAGPPAPTATPRPPQTQPVGFPIAPATHLGVVLGTAGSRSLTFDGTGPTAYDYALNDQPSPDPAAANRSGWNCRTHYEYEGIAALDFYIPIGTPTVSTMDGQATLYAISYVNDFDRYGVSREPYIGDPDRSRAPYSPFPGPSGGLGVYLHVENGEFTTEYGHLDLGLSLGVVPRSGFIRGFSPGSDYASFFADVPRPRVATPIAEWDVLAGEVIGMSGDAGYSEGPHLHYTIQRAAGGPLLCPTTEAAFRDNGWLFR